MKIAIISDIHENFHNLALFYKDISDKNIEQIFCLGDLMNAGIAKVISFSKIPAFLVRGNNDGARLPITKVSLKKDSVLTVSDETFDTFDLGGKKFFLTHYPLLAKSVTKSGDYDVVCFGHSHIKSIDKFKDCLAINPGSLGNSGTYAIYDTETHNAELINTNGWINLRTDFVSEYHKKIGYTRTKDVSRSFSL